MTLIANEENKRRLETAVHQFCIAEYGYEDDNGPELFDEGIAGQVGIAYSTFDTELPNGEEVLELDVQTDIMIAPDGTFQWHAYTFGPIECEYFEPFDEEELDALADYGFDSIYSWAIEHLNDKIEAGEYTYYEEEEA